MEYAPDRHKGYRYKITINLIFFFYVLCTGEEVVMVFCVLLFHSSLSGELSEKRDHLTPCSADSLL